MQINGVDYARILRGPGLKSVPELQDLLAYRSQLGAAPIGDKLKVDLIWQDTPGEGILSLRQNGQILAEGTLSEIAIPEQISLGRYELYLDETFLDEIDVHHTRLPADYEAFRTEFADEIALLGYKPEPVLVDQSLRLSLAFEATPVAWADYVLYVHLIDAAGNRVTGHDSPPPRPTSQWQKNEVVLFDHVLSLPNDLQAQDYGIRLGFYQSDPDQALGEAVVLPLSIPINP